MKFVARAISAQIQAAAKAFPIVLLTKRLIKSPKLYWLDSGLASHILGIETQSQLRRSTFAGPLFEGFVAAEIVKQQINAGRRREIYYIDARDDPLHHPPCLSHPGRRHS